MMALKKDIIFDLEVCLLLRVAWWERGIMGILEAEKAIFGQESNLERSIPHLYF